LGGQAPLPWSEVAAGSAFHPIPVGSAGLGVTVIASVPEIEPSFAVIVGVPLATPLTKPVALTVASLVFEDDHVTELERFCVLESVKVPVAVSCSVPPMTTMGVCGVTAMETNAAGPTVSNVEVFTLPDAAPMVLLPFTSEVARPVPLIVATVVVPEVHVTVPLKFCVL
jgi:hypothetical protein